LDGYNPALRKSQFCFDHVNWLKKALFENAPRGTPNAVSALSKRYRS